MNFLEKVEKIRREVLNEADAAPLPPGADANAQANPTPQEVQAAQPETPPETEQPAQETDKLTLEGEVMLIRLLKKAFVIAPKPEDVEAITDIGEVNESNAREALKGIIQLMKKYSSDIDID